MTDAPIRSSADIRWEFRRRMTPLQKTIMAFMSVFAVGLMVGVIFHARGVFADAQFEQFSQSMLMGFVAMTVLACGSIAMSMIEEGKAVRANEEKIAALLRRRYKIYTVVSREAMAKMGDEVGKMFAQGGHAALHAWWDSLARFPVFAHAYKDSQHAFKITLVVDTDAELEALYEAFKPICGVSLVRDAGFTVFKEPTITCLGIGPLADEDKGALASLKTLRPAKSK